MKRILLSVVLISVFFIGCNQKADKKIENIKLNENQVHFKPVGN